MEDAVGMYNNFVVNLVLKLKVKTDGYAKITAVIVVEYGEVDFFSIPAITPSRVLVGVVTRLTGAASTVFKVISWVRITSGGCGKYFGGIGVSL